MKKKFLSLIAVSAALATAGSALIACGGGDKGDAKTEVTKEQWTAALSLGSFENNFKASIFTVNEHEKATQEYIFAVGAEKYGDYSMTRIMSSLQGEKQREDIRIRIVGTEKDAYYERRSAFESIQGEDGEWTKGDWKEGEWRVEYKGHEADDDEEWTETLGSIGLAYTFKFADKYDSFEYKNGAYTYNGKDGIVIHEYTSDPDYDYTYSTIVTATDIVVKFVDGKLASAEVTMKDHYESNYYGESETIDTTFTVSFKVFYGTQKIDEPTVVVEDEEDE